MIVEHRKKGEPSMADKNQFDKKWNIYLFALQAIVYLSIISWLAAANHFAATCDGINFIANFFTKDFSIAFFGAAGGGAALLFLGFLQKEREALSNFNAAKAILATHINNLLNLKKQFAVPHFVALQADKETFELAVWLHLRRYSLGSRNIAFGNYLQHIHEFPVDFVLPLASIAKYADKNSKTLMLVMKAKESISAVAANIRFKNRQINTIEKIQNDTERAHRIFGVPMIKRNGGEVTDAKFYDATEGLLHNTDFALIFLKRAIDSLDRLASESVAWWLKGKINKVEILFKDYMPPDDLIDAW